MTRWRNSGIEITSNAATKIAVGFGPKNDARRLPKSLLGIVICV